MTCSPLQTAPLPPATGRREATLRHADEVLARNGGRSVEQWFGEAWEGARGESRLQARAAATATALMDLYRCTGASEVFDCLVAVATPDLMGRVRGRMRSVGPRFDAQEVLQDTIVNIFRYPDRFAANRYNAFAAWSAAIVDNAIRRLVRGRRAGPPVALSPIEILSQQADRRTPEPDHQAVQHEETHAAAAAYGIVLACYLDAFTRLNDRERFVLQMVEVGRMRYAELGQLLGIRPEAVKMVVFRARRRVFERIAVSLRGPAGLVAAVAAA